MKKLALAISISVVSITSSAVWAADLPVKVAAAPPIPSWAGFYIGGHGGYGWMEDPFSFTTPAINVIPSVTLNGFKSRGWIAGGQVGYNWQYGAIVGGLELDVSATGIKGSTTASASVDTIGDNVKFLGSVRGRLGFAPSPDWLLYGTGGLAWERMEQTSTIVQEMPAVFGTQTVTSLQPVDRFGAVIGAGIETKIMRSSWIARLEYLHYDFGHSRATTNVITTPASGFNTIGTAGNQALDVVRGGLSYKFGD